MMSRTEKNAQKKTEIIRIRATPELKKQLQESALMHMRDEPDEARAMLEVMLGMRDPHDDKRLSRFNELRAQGKKFGEINTILEQEGFSEVSGEGVMKCGTKHHQIVRENKGVKRMIQKGICDNL